MTHKPVVLFVCVHNAGRSQMAAGFMASLSHGKVEVLSAGSAPKESINLVAVEAMAEAGQGITAIRIIRDEIKQRVQALLAELLPNG